MIQAEPVPAGEPQHAAIWRELAGGWNIILAAFLAVGLHSLPSYSFGAVIGPLARDLGADTPTVALWSIFWSGGAILCALIVGTWVDRVGARRVILSALPLFALVLGAKSLFVDGIASLFGFAFLTGMACTALGSMASGRLVADRFRAGLGSAFGLMATGIGLAALAGPITLQQIVDARDWQTGYLAMALLAFAVWPLFWLLTRSVPQSTRSAASAMPVAALAPIMLTPVFVLLAAGTFLFGMIVTGASVNLILFLQSLGFERVEAAGAVGAFGVFTVLGRILTGFVLDRLALHIGSFMALILLVLACSFAVLASGSTIAVLVALVVFGFAVGAEADCLSFAVVRLFGHDLYGRVYGLLGVGVLLLGAGFGPVIFSYLAAHAGGYPAAFAFWAALAAGSSVLFVLTRTAPYFDESPK